MDRGNWLIVQNCNFSERFLYKIEYLLEKANENWNPNFRLWLIYNEYSLNSKSFPTSLLLRSLKGNLHYTVPNCSHVVDFQKLMLLLHN